MWVVDDTGEKSFKIHYSREIIIDLMIDTTEKWLNHDTKNISLPCIILFNNYIKQMLLFFLKISKNIKNILLLRMWLTIVDVIQVINKCWCYSGD